MVSYPDHSHRGVAQPWTISVGNVSFHDEFGADVPSLPLRKHNGLYYYYTPPLMHSPSTLYAPLPFKPRMSPPAFTSIYLMKMFPFPSMRCLWCLMMTCHHMGMGQPGHNHLRHLHSLLRLSRHRPRLCPQIKIDRSLFVVSTSHGPLWDCFLSILWFQ